MALFSIPSIQPQNFYDQFLSRAKSNNELTKQNLENKYYAPNIESEIANRNALTKGYNINNQYAPDRLRLANEHAGLENKYYGRNIESEMGLRGAQKSEAEALAGMHGTDNKINALKYWYMKNYMQGMGNNNQLNNTGSSPSQQAPNQSANFGGGGLGGSVPSSSGQMTNQPANQGQASPQQMQNQGGNSQSNPKSSSAYGIETPMPTREDIGNKMFLGTDTYSSKIENAKKQQQDQYEQFKNKIESSATTANAANDMDQAISVFDNAMNRSFYKGSRFGHLPSSGILSPPGNLSPEQEADRSAIQMLPAAMEKLRDAMGNSRFSNLDTIQAGKMKFDRTMNDETRELQKNWVNGVDQRLKEEPKFYQVMSDPNKGVTKQQADMLFQAYQNNNPIIGKDKDGNDVVKFDNLKNWPLYTTPKAIDSIKRTGTYKPSKSEMNTYMMKYPDGNVLPVKKGMIEDAFSKGASPL